VSRAITPEILLEGLGSAVSSTVGPAVTQLQSGFCAWNCQKSSSLLCLIDICNARCIYFIVQL